MTELATQTQLATSEPSVGAMLSTALQSIQTGEITTAHVDVLGKMMDLYERNDKRQAEKDFAEALSALQSETIRVAATKKVEPKSDGSCRYKFAPYEEIMAVVQPMLTRHGFSVTFDTEASADNARLTSICTLTHKGGHSRSNRFAVRYGKPPGSSDAQGDMSTKSYAKRGALCDALNIAIDHDDDARNEGGETITADEAKELQRRAKACGADIAKFLSFAHNCPEEQVPGGSFEVAGHDFRDIPASKLESLLNMIARKEREALAAKEERNPDGSFKF